MKRTIFALALSSLVYLSSCQKSDVDPATTQTQENTNTITGVNPLGPVSATNDPINVSGYLKLLLAKGNSSDGILIDFNPRAKSIFVKNEDAAYMQGFSQVSLTGLSSDNVPLTIDVLPLTQTGTSVALDVEGKNDGTYTLTMDTIESVPQSFHIWLKDNYKKDSLDLRQNPVYFFDLHKADTTTFGKNRFKVSIHE